MCGGISQQFRKQCREVLLGKIICSAPYTFKGDLSDPHTIIRDAKQAMICVMRSYLLSEMCFGHSPYHESKIIEEEVQHVTFMHHLYAHDLRIPLGARVYEFPQLLTVCITGDGGRIPKVPMNTPLIALAFVRVLGLNYYAHHSRHSGLPVMISKLGDHHPNLPGYMFEVCQNLNGAGCFYIYHVSKQCYCVYKYKRWDNADWAWSHKMCNNAVGPTGAYGLPGITRYNNGNFKGVLNRTDKLYHCLDHGITTNEKGLGHDKLIRDGFVGYTLTTTEVANIWGHQVDARWNEYVAKYPNKIFTSKQQRKKRIQFAREMQIGVLGVSNVSNWGGIFDVCHAWWSWMNYILCFVIMLMWCVWNWSEEQLLMFVSCLGVEFITKQVKDYIQDNKKRSVKKYISIHTNGIILRTVLHQWHEALCQAAVIACDRYDEGIDLNEHCITLLCVFIRISTKMRKSFGTLLTDSFTWPTNGSRPPKIQELIDDVRLATYIAYHCCKNIVCYLCCL